MPDLHPGTVLTLADGRRLMVDSAHAPALDGSRRFTVHLLRSEPRTGLDVGKPVIVKIPDCEPEPGHIVTLPDDFRQKDGYVAVLVPRGTLYVQASLVEEADV